MHFFVYYDKINNIYKFDFDPDRASHPYKYWKAFAFTSHSRRLQKIVLR